MRPPKFTDFTANSITMLSRTFSLRLRFVTSSDTVAPAGIAAPFVPVVASVVVAVKVWPTLRKNPMGAPACAVFALLTLVAVGFLRWPMVWVVLGLGSSAMALAWRRLGR